MMIRTASITYLKGAEILTHSGSLVPEAYLDFAISIFFWYEPFFPKPGFPGDSLGQGDQGAGPSRIFADREVFLILGHLPALREVLLCIGGPDICH